MYCHRGTKVGCRISARDTVLQQGHKIRLHHRCKRHSITTGLRTTVGYRINANDKIKSHKTRYLHRETKANFRISARDKVQVDNSGARMQASNARDNETEAQKYVTE
jgi:hypothetical protein